MNLLDFLFLAGIFIVIFCVVAAVLGVGVAGVIAAFNWGYCLVAETC